MRTRSIAAVVALAVLMTIFSLRHHVRDLHEMFTTYNTFHTLIKQHPQLLYRYHSSANTPPTIPKIIHQIALGPANLTKYTSAIDSCRSLHSSWEYNLWTTNNATDFIATHFPTILPHYEPYAQEIQRANILRYALLHHTGGIYLDLDITCCVTMDSTPPLSLPFVTLGAHPAGVNNAFIASIPAHPFLTELLARVPSRDLSWALLGLRLPYVENMLSTGCMFFSNAWTAFVRSHLSRGKEVEVYVLADMDGGMASHMLRGKVTTNLFVHGGASSWHGWDGRGMVWIGAHYYLFAIGLGAVIVAVLMGFVRCCVRRRGTRLRRRLLSPELRVEVEKVVV